MLARWAVLLCAPGAMAQVAGDAAWSHDYQKVYYLDSVPVGQWPTRVKMHTLGTDSRIDGVVYEETDENFRVSVGKTGDGRWVVITLQSTDSSEVRAIDPDVQEDTPVLLAPRTPGIQYRADHRDGRWVIYTNSDAPGFRRMTVADAQMGDRARWQELSAPDEPGGLLCPWYF